MSSRWGAAGNYVRAAGFLALLGLVALRLIDPWPVEALRLRLFDLLQDVNPRTVDAAPVAIVAIDEMSLAELGQWPWPRDLVAELVDAIAAQKPAAIGFDVLFVEPDRLSPERLGQTLGRANPALARLLADLPSNDAALARSIAAAPVALGVAASPIGSVAPLTTGGPGPAVVPLLERGGAVRPYVKRFGAFTQTIPTIALAADGHGVVSLDLGADGVLRRAPALARVDERVLPALALEAIRIGAGAQAFEAEAGWFGLKTVSVADVRAPTDANGDIWLRYAGHRADRFVSASDVLAGKVAPDALAGKLVLIGATAAGLGDIVATPLGYPMAGVEVHAELIEALLAGETLSRPAFMTAVEIALVCAFGLFVTFGRPFRRPTHLISLFVAPAAAAGGLAWALFAMRGLLFDPVYPALSAAALLTVVVSASFIAGERRQRLLAERAALIEREARERIELLLESTGEAIYGVDLAGACSFYNSATISLLGLPPGFDPIGRNMHELSHHADKDGGPFAEADCFIHSAFRDGRTAETADDVVWRSDGAAVAVEQRAFPIHKDGQVVGAVVIVIDIRERKAAAAAIAERETRLGQLRAEIDAMSRMGVLAQVSSFLAHEINQPLAAVMNYIPASRRILAGTRPDAQEKSADYLEKALQQARRAADIVKGLREMTQSGEAERELDDLNRVIEEAVEIAAMEHAGRPARIVFQRGDGLAAVDVSRIQIQQIVINLVRNAIEAIGPGVPGRIEVSVQRVDGAWAAVAVRDSGPGLPEEADALFQPFVTSKPTGMGVGLAISERIVQAHGGEISASNHSDGGAVFRFTLPFVEAPGALASRSSGS